MGLLGRLARGPLGNAAAGAGVGGALGGMAGGGDPNAIGMGAALGAANGVGLGMVGRAGARDALREVGLDGGAAQILQRIRQAAQNSPQDAEFLLAQLRSNDDEMYRQVLQLARAGGG